MNKEQWEELVNLYGIFAYTMCSYFHFDGDTGSDLASNQVAFDLIKDGYSNRLRIKESAALPFDLDAAKAGDSIEVLTVENTYIDCSLRGILDNNNEYLIGTISGLFVVNEKDLRMKHPRRVRVDYGN